MISKGEILEAMQLNHGTDNRKHYYYLCTTLHLRIQTTKLNTSKKTEDIKK
jgi:hypothetical protein